MSTVADYKAAQTRYRDFLSTLDTSLSPILQRIVTEFDSTFPELTPTAYIVFYEAKIGGIWKSQRLIRSSEEAAGVERDRRLANPEKYRNISPVQVHVLSVPVA